MADVLDSLESEHTRSIIRVLTSCRTLIRAQVFYSVIGIRFSGIVVVWQLYNTLKRYANKTNFAKQFGY